MLERDLANDTGARLAAAHALSLLGNCAVDSLARTALASYHHDATAKIVPVLRCGVPVLVERAAALLGNMCTDTTMRSKLAANARGISDLVALLPSEKDSTAGPAAPAGMGAGLAGLKVKAASPRDRTHVKDPELVLNVLAALANATADVTAAAAAGTAGATGRLAALLAASDPTVGARAATVLSRLARDPSTAKGMCARDGEGGAGAVARFVGERLRTDAETRAAGSESDQKYQKVEPFPGVEPAVRTLAVLANGGDAAARLALAECASEALVECIRVGELVGDGVVGNAALAIGDLAKEGTGRDKFAALEPVKPLLAVCHKRTGAAQKNAAIACARLASHPDMLETLKANNGLELIYRYVQP